MRNAFCDAVVACAANPDFIFLTGDLGFNALEPLQAAAGPRFLNAGVAEQNMVSVAAGLASTGLKPWAYSIAPFIYARPFEQVRNDVCLHDLPVTLVGNGGGYGYGVQGGTHHALEDYGILLALQKMNAFVPAFASDLAAMVPILARFSHPAYLRLGRDETPKGWTPPPYAAWRRVVAGQGATVVVVGPLVGPLITAVQELPESRRPNVWVVTELPIRSDALPAEFLADLRESNHLLVAEEHVSQGSAGQALASTLLATGAAPARFQHRCAVGYVSGRYGSQQYHRRESGLDATSLVAALQ